LNSPFSCLLEAIAWKRVVAITASAAFSGLEP
jgi:hypothetical protein